MGEDCVQVWIRRWLASLCIAWVLSPGAGFAATVIVDTLNDLADSPFDADGACGSGTLSELPGSDNRISLREAIVATNNTPGPHTIVFSDGLRGGVIHIGFDNLDMGNAPNALPQLCRGDVTIDGDSDDDGTPDVT